MSSSRALCCLPSVKKQKHDLNFFRAMYNKTIIRFGFCDIQNNQGLGKGDHPYLDLDYSAIFLANNRLMDVTQLALTWVGWPNGEKLASTWVSQKPHPIIVYYLAIFKL